MFAYHRRAQINPLLFANYAAPSHLQTTLICTARFLLRIEPQLDQHAATMPRTTLRYAIKHLEPEQRQHYLAMKKDTKNTKKA